MKQHLIYQSQALAITNVRVVTNRVLALVVQNDDDQSQNGIWKMNIDGTGLTRLSTYATTTLNTAGQYTWSNFSRDSSFYAAATTIGETQSLVYGSLQGGIPTTIESYHANTVPDVHWSIAGWTSL